MAKLLNVLHAITKKITAFYGLLFFIMVFYISINVISRKFLNFSLQGVNEFGGYILAIICAMGFAYAYINNSHIRIEMLLPKFNSSVRAVLNLIAHLTIGIYGFFFVRYSFKILLWSISRGSKAATPLETPLWLPQILWVFGFVWFFILIITTILHLSILFVKKDYKEINIFCDTDQKDD